MIFFSKRVVEINEISQGEGAKKIPKPSFATKGSLGIDLRARIKSEVLLPSKCLIKIPSGIAVRFPKGVGGLVFPRSGLSLKGIVLANGIGVIDSDYTDEIMLPLINNSERNYKIEVGERVAQMLFFERLNLQVKWGEGELPVFRGGFGSTGRL